MLHALLLISSLAAAAETAADPEALTASDPHFEDQALAPVQEATDAIEDGPPSETYGVLTQTAADVIRLVQEGRIQEARAAIEDCPVDPEFSGRQPLNHLATLLASYPSVESGKINGYDLDAVHRLGIELTWLESVQPAVRPNQRTTATKERRALDAAAVASFVTLDALALAPLAHDTVHQAGLLHAGGALLAIDRILTGSGRFDPRVSTTADHIRAGIDPVSALRLSGAEAYVQVHRKGDDGEHVVPIPPLDVDSLNAALDVVSWVAEAPWVSPHTRGLAAHVGLDLTELGLSPASERYTDRTNPRFRAFFLQAAVGTSEACASKRVTPVVKTRAGKLLGATTEQATLAVERVFHWRQGLGGDNLVQGDLVELEPEQSQQVLCFVALRSDVGASVPAALALAEWVFMEDHLRARTGTLSDNKHLAYQFALVGLQNAARLRADGRVPRNAWWVREFGSILTPLLHPMNAPAVPNKPRDARLRQLHDWVAQRGTRWLIGDAEAPTWLQGLQR